MNNTKSIRTNEDRFCRFRRISDNGFRLAIEVTRNCNLYCKHCFVRSSKVDPEADEIIDIIKQAKQFNCRKLIITGGEPLIRPDLEKIISAATDQGILVDLNSNLFSLTHERVDRLKAAGLQEASVSLYGVESFHDNLTGKKGSFDRVLHGIDLLRDAGITVDVHGAVWNKMLPCINELIDIVQKHDVSSVTFFSLIPTETWTNTGQYIISPDLAIKTISQVRESTSMPIRTIGLQRIANVESECQMGKSIYGIGTDMMLSPCLLSNNRFEKWGVSLRKHDLQEAISCLETQINHGEWCISCSSQTQRI